MTLDFRDLIVYSYWSSSWAYTFVDNLISPLLGILKRHLFGSFFFLSDMQQGLLFALFLFARSYLFLDNILDLLDDVQIFGIFKNSIEFLLQFHALDFWVKKEGKYFIKGPIRFLLMAKHDVIQDAGADIQERGDVEVELCQPTGGVGLGTIRSLRQSLTSFPSLSMIFKVWFKEVNLYLLLYKNNSNGSASIRFAIGKNEWPHKSFRPFLWIGVGSDPWPPFDLTLWGHEQSPTTWNDEKKKEEYSSLMGGWRIFSRAGHLQALDDGRLATAIGSDNNRQWLEELDHLGFIGPKGSDSHDRHLL